MSTLACLAVLFAAGLVLVGEARLRRLAGPRALRRSRIALYFAASAAGTALLVAATGREWVLFVALAPLTVLALARMVALLRDTGADARRGLAVAVLLAAAVWGCLQTIPEPLDRRSILEQIRYRDGAPPLPDSIDPSAFRPVQV